MELEVVAALPGGGFLFLYCCTVFIFCFFRTCSSSVSVSMDGLQECVPRGHWKHPFLVRFTRQALVRKIKTT